MTGKERLQSDAKKYMIAIIMMLVLCSLAVAGRAQISSLEDSGQITVEEEEPPEDETAETESSPPSEKVKPAEKDE